MSLADRRGPLGTDPYGTLFGRGGQRLYLERSPKRIRLVVAGVTIADADRPSLLHRPGVPAAWWVPRERVRTDLLRERGDAEDDPLLGRTRLFDLHAGDRVVERVVWTHPDVDALAGLVTVDWRLVERAYEEDDEVAPEPVDPFHRVDVRSTSRHVRISLGGVVLAESHTPRMLFETTARPRFYLSADEIRTDLLEPSATRSTCQYKGEAEYFHVRLGERVVADLAWRYPDPRHDGLRVAGRYVFHHERCRTVVDGELVADGDG